MQFFLQTQLMCCYWLMCILGMPTVIMSVPLVDKFVAITVTHFPGAKFVNAIVKSVIFVTNYFVQGCPGVGLAVPETDVVVVPTY